MTHPGMIVHASIYLYQRCIGYLLRHRKKKNKAREAFDLAKNDLNRPEFEEQKSTLSEWLQLSEDMSESQNK
jgi:ADP-ribosylglycohydrolase